MSHPIEILGVVDIHTDKQTAVFSLSDGREVTVGIEYRGPVSTGALMARAQR